MFMEQIIEFVLRGPGLPGGACNPKTGYLNKKTKISKPNLRLNCYLLLKILLKAMILAYLHQKQVNYKIYHKNARF